MFNLQRFSIRASLIGLVSVCLFPALVLAGLFLYVDFLDEREKLLRESLSTARALMANIDGEFAAAEASLYALSSSVELKNEDLRAFHDRANAVVDRFDLVNNIVLVDIEGQQLVNTAIAYGSALPRAVNVAQLDAVRTTGRVHVSNMFRGVVLQRPVINVAVPVFRNSAVVQALVAVLLPEQLQASLDRQGFPADRIVAIFDGSNGVVAVTGGLKRFVGQPVNPGLARALTHAQEGSIETVNGAGVDVLTVFTRSPGSRWGVAIGIPRANLMAELSRSIWLLMGMGALLLAFSGTLAYFIGGRISRAFHTLVGATKELGYGRPVAVPTLPIGEADEAGQALTSASVMLTETSNALSSSEARMRAIVESATDAVVILDGDCNIVLFNSAAVATFRCSRADAIGSAFVRFIPERLRADFLTQLLKQRESPGNETAGTQGISTGMRIGGDEFPIEMAFPKAVEGGNELQTLILRDITVRQRVYDALERSNLDLQQFAYVASHDLKTPLRSISGFVQLLQRNYASKLDEKAVDLIRRTAGATQRLEQLTDDLLSYARINAESRPFAPVDMGEVLTEVIQLLDSVINRTGACVTFTALPVVHGDRTQLVQLLLNLIGNGIKYCTVVPELRVSADKTGQDWTFSVRDNGIGMEPKHHERVFEIFERLHTQREYAGTGIGLAICRRVVRNHGGNIWVASSPGEGSTFSFTISDRTRGDFA